MSDDTDDLAKLIARLDAEGHGMEEHPPSERLSAYQADELPPAERAAVQEHLKACSFCRERVKDLEGFLAPVPEDPAAAPVADFETAAQWRRLREHLPDPGERGLVLKSLRRSRALAALLGALLLGLSIYTFRLQRDAASIRALPEAKLGFYETRSAGESGEVKVRLPVALKLVIDSEYPSYRIEIRANDDRLCYASEDYSREIVEQLSFPLPKGSLAPGTYLVKLFGLHDGRSEPIASPVKLTVQP